jgi:putative spermidine/putrescine transport system ATP-binding protein
LPDLPVDGCLVLHGEIVQCSYPGGFYRYAVRVGPRQYLVDDMRRLAIGEPIGIALPAAALHLYRATPAADHNKHDEAGRTQCSELASSS